MIGRDDVIALFGETIQLNAFAVVDADTFAQLFEDANSLTYAELVRVDAGIKGYKDFFDRCKRDGILN